MIPSMKPKITIFQAKSLSIEGLCWPLARSLTLAGGSYSANLELNADFYMRKPFLPWGKLLSSHIAASCLPPTGIKHGGHIGNDYGHGKTVRFQCDRQYILEGKDRVTCNDGKWDSDPPNCKGMYNRSAFKINAHITDFVLPLRQTVMKNREKSIFRGRS